jgi:hypothetical protein
MSPDANAIADDLVLAAYVAVVVILTVFLGLSWGRPDTALRPGAGVAFVLLAGAALALLLLAS